METLLKLLKDLDPSVDFEHEEHLIDDHLLDSLEIIELVSDIESEFDVDIPLNEVVPTNFQSAKAIYSLIERLQNDD